MEMYQLSMDTPVIRLPTTLVKRNVYSIHVYQDSIAFQAQINVNRVDGEEMSDERSVTPNV